MVENLQNTVTIVTGASSGIGRAIAKKLAAAGSNVVLVARRRQKLSELADEIEKANGKAWLIEADLTSNDEAIRVVKETIEKFDRLNILVNAAGVMLNGDSIETPVEDWDAMVNINLRGLMYLTKAALPYLKESAQNGNRRVSDVVNISSVAGRFAAAQVAIYSATKFAVTAATEAWRQEYTRQHIRFTVIEPGKTATELFHHRAGEHEAFEKMFGKVEELQAEDIANTVHFIVTSPRRVAINEVVIRPTDQA
ncbi:MAG: SDR family NAD(P)-dependent oxidoreductase [Sporolactobacillus sp.]